MIMDVAAKTHWTADPNKVSLSMPITKIDTERRLVSGFATLDNIDSQDDIVTAEASAEAFARARGNVREMHGHDAVGKVVDFYEDEFYDTNSQTFYRGIFVTTYVSKGAPNTWEKVLDGTLTGFSIGGNILEQSTQYMPDMDKSVRVVEKYDLVELSLVDNPANQLANIFSIAKSSDGSMITKGMVAETAVENVFWCDTHRVVKISEESETSCPKCSESMENVGWFETGSDRAEKVKEITQKFLGLNNADEQQAEGGVEMSEEIEKSEAVVEEEVVEETAEIEAEEEIVAAEEEEAEEAVEVDEVEDEATLISKKIDELKSAVDSSLEKTREETSEQVSALEKKIDEANQAFMQKASELEEKFSEFGKSLEAEKSRTAELEKKLDAINSSEAIKKSGDVESPVQVQKDKQVWSGVFSVDHLR